MSEHTITILHYWPHERPEVDVRAEVKSVMRGQLRPVARVLDGDTLTPGERQPVAVTEDGELLGHLPPGHPDVTGHIVTWTAEHTERTVDQDRVEAAFVEGVDRTAEAELPGLLAVEGGGVRVMHPLDTEDVTVTAFRRDREPIGYLFAQPLDPGSVHVETMPGTAYVRVVRDED